MKEARMASTPDVASCISPKNGSGAGLSPVNPFSALRYQFGMLLGVDDFDTEQAYHRGQMRLHNAWLHGEGVIWGLNVQLDEEHNEVRVTPGLAVDSPGRFLHLDTQACVDVSKWFEVHSKDAGFTPTATATGVKFDAHVVIAFHACLTRQVPALMEPCQNSGTETTYSRVFETVQLTLLPGLAEVKVKPYHRLRLLFWLEPPIFESDGVTPTAGDQAVLDDRTQIRTLPATEQAAAYLAAFRKYAALDEIDLKPATSADGTASLLFPGADDAVVLLADIHDITLDTKDGEQVLTGGTVDRTVRPSHVATSTIQELLCGPVFGDNPTTTPKASGPQVDPDSVNLAGAAITFTTDADLNPQTVQPAAFSVSILDAASITGWAHVSVDATVYTAASKTVALTLHTAPATGVLLRLVVRGTGPTPLLGSNGIALGGSSSNFDGQDFVFMKGVS
jgi:hypothetical protein